MKKPDDLTAKVEWAKQNSRELSGVLRKEFNIRETVKIAWPSSEAISNEQTFSLDEFHGAYCIGSVNLSITIDLTCVSLLFMKRGDDKKYVTQMYFMPADNTAERIKVDKIPMTYGTNADFYAYALETVSIIRTLQNGLLKLSKRMTYSSYGLIMTAIPHGTLSKKCR